MGSNHSLGWAGDSSLPVSVSPTPSPYIRHTRPPNAHPTSYHTPKYTHTNPRPTYMPIPNIYTRTANRFSNTLLQTHVCLDHVHTQNSQRPIQHHTPHTHTLNVQHSPKHSNYSPHTSTDHEHPPPNLNSNSYPTHTYAHSHSLHLTTHTHAHLPEEGVGECALGVCWMCAWVWHWECLRMLWVLTYRDTRGVQWVYVYLCHMLPNHNPSTYVLNCTDTPIPHQTSPTPHAQSPQCLTHTRVQAITRRHTHAHRPPAHTQRWNPLDSPLPALRASTYTPTLNFYGWRADPMGVEAGRDPMSLHTSPLRGLALCRGTQVAGGWAAPRGMGSPTGPASSGPLATFLPAPGVYSSLVH